MNSCVSSFLSFVLILLISMVIAFTLVGFVIKKILDKGSNRKEEKHEDLSYKRKAFICNNGECASCGRSLNGLRAYRITGDAFFDSKEYVNFCYRRSDEARKRTGDGLDYLIDAALHVLPEVKDMQDRENSRVICENCISMFDKNGII